jgi:hypothetical protein
MVFEQNIHRPTQLRHNRNESTGPNLTSQSDHIQHFVLTCRMNNNRPSPQRYHSPCPYSCQFPSTPSSALPDLNLFDNIGFYLWFKVMNLTIHDRGCPSHLFSYQPSTGHWNIPSRSCEPSKATDSCSLNTQSGAAGVRPVDRCTGVRFMWERILSALPLTMSSRVHRSHVPWFALLRQTETVLM